MEKGSTSLLSNGLLWFGAAVSIAEIMAGTLFAPLGFAKGFAAIILGHLIGCLLLYLVGLIGAQNRLTAMESVRISFGRKGSVIFSVLNILQLLGWTAVMIISGARAIGALANPALSLEGELFWCILIGLLVILWIVIGIKNLGKLNIFAVGALFILTIILSVVVFKGDAAAVHADAISFGMAVELSVAMPLSWLPLISDYTSRAAKPVATTLVSTLVYFLGSCWMYTIGLGAAIFSGETDIAQIMLTAGLGIASILIVLLATVTTTFLDVFSAGVSFTNITDRISEKKVATLATIIGMLIAMFTPIEQYENFLYLIGSVFAPMVAILVTDYFILGKSYADTAMNLPNLLLWLVGFIIYRQFMTIDTFLGSTLPVMIVIGILSILVNGGKSYVQNHAGKRRN
jgi:putative hydroxymethylpyrimidine transporter CytX